MKCVSVAPLGLVGLLLVLALHGTRRAEADPLDNAACFLLGTTSCQRCIATSDSDVTCYYCHKYGVCMALDSYADIFSPSFPCENLNLHLWTCSLDLKTSVALVAGCACALLLASFLCCALMGCLACRRERRRKARMKASEQQL